MAEQKILCEFYKLEYDTDKLRESIEAGKEIILSGRCQHADLGNANERKYPRNILEREIQNYTTAIKERRAYGELDHPQDTVVNLQNASHMMTEVWWEGNEVFGKLKLMETPTGNIAQAILKAGGVLGISSRGVGSTTSEGGFDVVQDDFQLICFDLVSEPSTPGAYVLPEGKRILRPSERNDRLTRIANNIIFHKKFEE